MYSFEVFVLVVSTFLLCQAHVSVHNKSKVQDINHMKQHLDGVVDLDALSEDELQFHYFKVHDVEGNDKLDGCELLQSILHFQAEESTFGFESRTFTDDELSMMIDPVLSMEDKNFDGFIDYAEFVSSQMS